RRSAGREQERDAERGGGQRGDRQPVHAGQRSGVRAPGSTQRSVRRGAALRLISISVHLPTKPGIETTIVSRTPARSGRSNSRNRCSAAVDARRRAGQPLPRHSITIRAPFGARTVSSVTRAPAVPIRPLIRTTGNGSRRRGRASAGRDGAGLSSNATAVGVGVGVAVCVGVGAGVGVL